MPEKLIQREKFAFVQTFKLTIQGHLWILLLFFYTCLTCCVYCIWLK